MQAALSNFRAALAARSAAAASSVHATLERCCCIGAAFAEMDDINRAVRWCAEQSAAASHTTPPTVARGAAASRQAALTAHLNESEERCVPPLPRHTWAKAVRSPEFGIRERGGSAWARTNRQIKGPTRLAARSSRPASFQYCVATGGGFAHQAIDLWPWGTRSAAGSCTTQVHDSISSIATPAGNREPRAGSGERQRHYKGQQPGDDRGGDRACNLLLQQVLCEERNPSGPTKFGPVSV